MPLVLMQAATDDPYPLALSDVGAQMNYYFNLKFKKTLILQSGALVSTGLSIGGSDPAQLYAKAYNATPTPIKVAPVVGFIRTGKMDTPVNVVLTGYQWNATTSKWIQNTSWLEQIPANVGYYTVAFAPVYSFFPNFWTYFSIALEHIYSAEGVSINQWPTSVEFTVNGG